MNRSKLAFLIFCLCSGHLLYTCFWTSPRGLAAQLASEGFDTGAYKRLAFSLRIATLWEAEEQERLFSDLKSFWDEAYIDIRNTEALRISDLEQGRLYSWRAPSDEHLLFIASADIAEPSRERLVDWRYDPYLGKIASDTIWGNGAKHNKVVCMALLEAWNRLAAEGFEPKKNLQLAIAFDSQAQEPQGHKALANILKENENTWAFFHALGLYESFFGGQSRYIALASLAEPGGAADNSSLQEALYKYLGPELPFFSRFWARLPLLNLAAGQLQQVGLAARLAEGRALHYHLEPSDSLLPLAQGLSQALFPASLFCPVADTLPSVYAAYRPFCQKALGFAPLKYSFEEQYEQRFFPLNERIALSDYKALVLYYYGLIQALAS